jgi:hypothetical protein
MTQVEEKNEKEEKKHPSSTELAADSSLIPVWDPAVPFPTPQEMPELDIVTHVTVERAKRGGYGIVTGFTHAGPTTQKKKPAIMTSSSVDVLQSMLFTGVRQLSGFRPHLSAGNLIISRPFLPTMTNCTSF